MLFLSRFIHQKKVIIGLWCFVAVLVSLKHNIFSTRHNNYAIFKYTYYHAVNGENLYWEHPSDHLDKNHYGPVFSLLFAPFALMPDALGEFFFVGGSIVLLLWAVYSLALKEWQKNVILLLCVNELLTAGFNVQFNIAVSAFFVLTYILIKRENEIMAPLPVLIGAFVKLYGIIGFALFFFVKDKRKFILGTLLWSVVLVVAPMILSSPQYVLNMYFEWFKALTVKNMSNVNLTTYQDISLIGFFRRTMGNPTLSSVPFLITGAVIFLVPFLRISQYRNSAYQLLMLASALIFPVLFSTSSENSTYIIPFVGIALWFVIQPKPYQRYHWVMLLLVIFLASLNSTDVYPDAFRAFLRQHSIKAVPCTIVWLRIIYEMLTKDFSSYEVGEEKKEQSSSVAG